MVNNFFRVKWGKSQVKISFTFSKQYFAVSFQIILIHLISHSLIVLTHLPPPVITYSSMTINVFKTMVANAHIVYLVHESFFSVCPTTKRTSVMFQFHYAQKTVVRFSIIYFNQIIIIPYFTFFLLPLFSNLHRLLDSLLFFAEIDRHENVKNT